MDNLTPDGKIKTIRCVKATHEDFAKLVNLGKKVMLEISDLEKNSGILAKDVQNKVENIAENSFVFADGTKHTWLELYGMFLSKQSELDAYRNAYHVLMEEGVDELLASIHIDPDSYNYDFYELCLEF